MAARSDGSPSRVVLWAVIIAVLVLGTWAFPPFHVVRLATAKGAPGPTGTAVFDAKPVAAKLWQHEIPAAAAKAVALDRVITALRKNPADAKAQFGRTVGVGVAYFFVRGRGRVVTRERNQLVIAPDGAPGEVVALRIGPVFGNTVRDGCGLVDLNSFPGLAEFNALSSELNALVEQNVLPTLRAKAQVGATVTFAGCAEAPDVLDDPGEPVLTIVPVEAQVP